jgi:hypothetical protein
MSQTPSTQNPRDFARRAELKSSGIFAELWSFLRHNKKWWMTPIVIVLMLMGVLVFLAGSGAAPFIYTLF